MSTDPVESPLAVRTRPQGESRGGSSGLGPEAGGALGQTQSAAPGGLPTSGTLDSAQSREWRDVLTESSLNGQVAALTRWFDTLPGAERAAIAAVLVEKCPPSQTAIVESALRRARGASYASVAAMQSSSSGSFRADLFEQFQATIDGPMEPQFDASRSPGDAKRRQEAAGSGSANVPQQAPGTPSLRGFSNHGSVGGSVTGSPFAINSFISPVGNDLYSQAFMPFSGNARQFTPWSLSQEIGRPKSATADVPSQVPQSTQQQGQNFSYQRGHTWSPSASSAPGAIGSSLGRSTPAGPPGAPGGPGATGPPSAPVSAGTPGAPGSGVPADKRPWGPVRTGRPASSDSNATPSVIGSRPGAANSTGRVSASASPSITRATVASNGSTTNTSNANQGSRTPGLISAPRSVIGSGAPSASSPVSTTNPAAQKWPRPFSPGSPALSPYSPKRAVDFMDPELLQDVGAWLRSLRLHKYTDNLAGMAWQDVVMLDDADLEARGVNALGARRKMLKMFEMIRAAQQSGQLPK